MKRNPERAIRIACILCLISLALMTWSIVDPSPIPVVMAMSAGQVFGTLGLLIYAIVVVRDIVARRLLPNLLSGERVSMRPGRAEDEAERPAGDEPRQRDGDRDA